MSDSQLADALERCTLDALLFTHEAHLRIAFHFLQDTPWLVLGDLPLMHAAAG